MCTKPIRIKNPTKYLNLHSGQQYYIYVNCGHCEECTRQKQIEWTLRTYYQALNTIQKNGYYYFDTLTYNNNSIPRLTKYIEINKNWQCFDYKDIRNFYETLRQYYKVKDTDIKYFITSEYGELRHRPHYHIILFIENKNIKPLDLSRNVAKAWTKGRTDGIPYKSKKYVLEHNVINNINLDTIRYVSKYITKSQTFMQIVNKRWQQIQYYLDNHTTKNELEKKKIKAKYYRHTTPFHRQSQHYGENALLYTSIKYIMEYNRLLYKDDSLQINKYVTLPMYFKRKLFQQQIKYNGKTLWIWNDTGQKYKEYREQKTIENIYNRLRCANTQLNKHYHDKLLYKISKYILLERGRLYNKNYKKKIINVI